MGNGILLPNHKILIVNGARTFHESPPGPSTYALIINLGTAPVTDSLIVLVGTTNPFGEHRHIANLSKAGPLRHSFSAEAVDAGRW